MVSLFHLLRMHIFEVGQFSALLKMGLSIFPVSFF